MRTTLDLDPSVLDELKSLSRREHKSMGQVASELLARRLGQSDSAKLVVFRWRSADLGEPLADLEDKVAVQAILDRGN